MNKKAATDLLQTSYGHSYGSLWENDNKLIIYCYKKNFLRTLEAATNALHKISLVVILKLVS